MTMFSISSILWNASILFIIDLKSRLFLNLKRRHLEEIHLDWINLWICSPQREGLDGWEFLCVMHCVSNRVVLLFGMHIAHPPLSSVHIHFSIKTMVVYNLASVWHHSLPHSGPGEFFQGWSLCGWWRRIRGQWLLWWSEVHIFCKTSLPSIKTVNLCFVFSGYFRYKTVDLDHDHARLFVRVWP